MARFVGIALSLLLALPMAASANWRSFSSGPAVAVRSYYYPAAVYSVPVAYPVMMVPAPAYAAPPVPVAVPPICPTPVAPVPYAQPPLAAPPVPAMPPAFAPVTPAPPSSPTPSGSPAAPPVTGSAKVSETRFFDTYAVASGSNARPADGRCSVAFWNLTGQDVTLKVGAQTLPLARGKNATLELPHEFTWQVDGREAQTQKVPAAEAGLEIVVRR